LEEINSMWPKLIHLALLETDKRPAPDLVLEPAVRDALSGADTGQRESYFLKAAAYSLVRHQAGTRPGAALPVPPAAETEQLNFCAPDTQFILRKLLADPARNSLLIGYTLEKMKSKQLVVPPALLVSIMEWLAHHKKQTEWWKSLVSVLGARGRWLAQQNAEWKYLFEEKSMAQITHASQTERRKWLAELRPIFPEQVFDYIRHTWASEGIPERRELLKILSMSFRQEEVVFIQTVYEDLCQPDQMKKAANRALRKNVAALLMAQPTAVLFQQIVAQLRPYLDRPKTVLNLPGKLKWVLPAKYDPFFCPEIMVNQFDFDTNEHLPRLSEAEFWLSELVLHLHPVAWETLIAPDWPTILAFLETADYSNKAWPLLQNGSQALARTQYRPGILVYAERYTLSSANTTILHVFTQEELAAWLLKTPELPDAGLLKPVLAEQYWQWSPELSRLLLRHFMREDNIYQNAATACDLCLHFDLVVVNDLFQFVNREASNWQQHQMIKTLAMPLLELLRLRQEIERLQ